MSLKVLLLSRTEQPLKHFHILSLKKKRQRVLGTFRLFSKLILSVADFFPVTSLVILFILMVLRSEKKNRPMINEFTAKIFSCFPVELSINVQNNCICVSYFSVGKLFFSLVLAFHLLNDTPPINR